MKFITIGKVHYNLDLIVVFGHHNHELRIQCAGQDGRNYATHNDPHGVYYKKLCDATGVIPAEVSE